MEGNALELVRQGKLPSEQQAKELLTVSWQGRVANKQNFAVGVWVLRQVCREGEGGFLAHMMDMYDYEKGMAHRYAQVGGVLTNLSTAIDREWLPQSIGQAVELASLPKEQQIAVWDSLLDKYEPKKITQQIVADHVAMLKGIPAPPADVQETESPVVQETEPVEAELVEDDEPEDDGPEFYEMEEAEESAPPPPPPAKRTFAPHPNFPPYGISNKEDRLGLMALGANFVRRIETEQRSIIYHWQEAERSEGGWQLLYSGNVRQTDVQWEKLKQSRTAFES